MRTPIKQPWVVALLASSMATSVATAQTTKNGAEFVGETVYPAKVTVKLNELAKPDQWKPGDAVKEIPFRFHRPKDWQRPDPASRGFGYDPLATKQLNAQQPTQLGGAMFDSTIVNVEGLGFTGVNPSDTNGDVGIDHYIQSINNGNSSGVLILNKSDGSVATQFVMSAIAAGSGTGCGAGNGDPIIMFDQFVDNGAGNPKGRWVLTEFTGDSLCLYISKTHDPIGPQNSSTWYIYEFDSASGQLPDYPKFGVWQDGYYVGANEANRLYAFDRENMLNGDPARGYQVFQAPGLPGFGFQHMMPADADGDILPPADAPAIFMRHRDSEYHGAQGAADVLELWEFTTDFDTPSNSALTGPTNIVISEFDTNLGGTNFGDLSVPQPGNSTNLFPLKQPLMWRVQHRTIDDKQYLVGNMVTDVDGNDYHGVRWWQLERPAATATGGWLLKDEGTYTNNDGVHRWMASAAMDGSGNIALGYNTSGSSTFAGMRYAGRLKDDAPGTMTRGENSIIEGSAANGSSRYGDYSSISVDPVDECTFWYTAQYNPSSQWSTRVGSFRFESCGCQLSLTPVTLNAATTPSDNTIALSWDDSVDAEVSEYSIYRSTSSGSGYELIATINDSTPGVGSDGQYNYEDTTVSGGSEYFYVVRTSDGAACNADDSNQVSATATGVCTLAPQFSGISAITNQATATCALEVEWAAATSMCPNGNGQITYDLFRSETPGFTPDLSNQIAADLTGISYADVDVMSDVDYHYIVRAKDADNQLSDDNSNEQSGFATGVFTAVPFTDDLESYVDLAAAEAAGWSHGQQAGTDDWRLLTGNDNTTGSGNAFVSTDVAEVSDKFMVTKTFTPSANSVLSFYHNHTFESGQNGDYDGGILEISLDGGNNWQDLGNDITTGGYNVNLAGGYDHPFAPAPAWGADSNGFYLVEVNLSAYAGQIAQVRWRMGTDNSVGDGDWLIDDINISNAGEYGVCTLFDPDLIFKHGFEQD